jgi:hypothetical protein
MYGSQTFSDVIHMADGWCFYVKYPLDSDNIKSILIFFFNLLEQSLLIAYQKSFLTLPSLVTELPSSLSTRCGHVTKCRSTRCEQK